MNQTEISKALPLEGLGRLAIVTGASGNMGQAVVKKFLAEGYNVVGTIIPNDPVPFEVDDARLEKVIVDLMNEEDSAKFVQNVITKYGSVDVAVLTVGGFAMGKVADTKTADVHKQYKLNFETAYNIARPCFVQMMQQDSGRIFIIGSKPGLSAKDGKGMIAYGLGKSLIFRLAELMNDEAKGYNVVTSVVIPSTIDTPQNRKAMPDAKFENWVKANLLPMRSGSIARMQHQFFVSRSSKYIIMLDWFLIVGLINGKVLPEFSVQHFYFNMSCYEE